MYFKNKEHVMQITSCFWDRLPDGRHAHLFTIRNQAGSSVTISDFGGIITSLFIPDSSGRLDDVVLGFDSLQGYLQDKAFLGAMVGRYANRIRNASFTLNDTQWMLEANERGNHLHGGTAGFHKQLWEASIQENGLLLHYRSPHLESGFPGTLDTSILYSLTEDNCLRLDISAVSDRDTVCCITNHSYFNLTGSGSIRNHQFQICAQQHTPFGPDLLPMGNLQPVAGTDLDYRSPRPLTQDNLDANFALDPDRDFSAAVFDPVSGRKMILRSDLPGLQFYAAGALRAEGGKHGRTYSPCDGFCLEPQHFPDSPNLPHFPSAVLRAGDVYHHVFEYQFLAE